MDKLKGGGEYNVAGFLSKWKLNYETIPLDTAGVSQDVIKQHGYKYLSNPLISDSNGQPNLSISRGAHLQIIELQSVLLYGQNSEKYINNARDKFINMNSENKLLSSLKPTLRGRRSPYPFVDFQTNYYRPTIILSDGITPHELRSNLNLNQDDISEWRKNENWFYVTDIEDRVRVLTHIIKWLKNYKLTSTFATLYRGTLSFPFECLHYIPRRFNVSQDNTEILNNINIRLPKSIQNNLTNISPENAPINMKRKKNHTIQYLPHSIKSLYDAIRNYNILNPFVMDFSQQKSLDDHLVPK